jgi:hypothetical protein
MSKEDLATIFEPYGKVNIFIHYQRDEKENICLKVKIVEK